MARRQGRGRLPVLSDGAVGELHLILDDALRLHAVVDHHVSEG